MYPKILSRIRLALKSFKVWRIGIMGYNATEANVNFMLEKLEEAINQFK